MDPKSVSEVQKQIRLLPSLELNTELGYSCNKIKLRPEFKFPAKIEMAFSQMLAIRS